MRSYEKSMNKREQFIVNEKINFPELRIINDDGEQMGVMKTKQALNLARISDLDLIVITEQATPPVAKITEYSKFKYELQKKEKENAKKNRLNKIELKEIGLRLNTDIADLTRLKLRSEEWLNKGNKVKINLQLKGRENHKKQEGRAFLENFVTGVSNAVIEGKINDAARGFNVIIQHKK